MAPLHGGVTGAFYSILGPVELSVAERYTTRCARPVAWHATTGRVARVMASVLARCSASPQTCPGARSLEGCAWPLRTWGCRRTAGAPQRGQAVTLAMAAGLTDHGWTMEEVLSDRGPPDLRDRLAQPPTEDTA
jgi:hypothetical protein